MLRPFSNIIIIFCITKIVFAASKQRLCQCGKNEVLSNCVNRVCEYRKCSDVGKPIECIKLSYKRCVRGCKCRHKYLRAENGTCILESLCPNARKCPTPNEYYDVCPPKCPSRTCTVMDTVKCPVPLQVGDPRCPPPSCRCKVGFYRDSYGSCVTWNLCEKCTENERPTLCIQSSCGRRNCSDLVKPVSCVKVDPKLCSKGCLCKDGFLRNEKGTCVPFNQCKEAQCEGNEFFDNCPSTCPGEECGVNPNTTSCLPKLEPGDPNCQPRCRCCDGYLRNKTGKCIPKDECQICKENERPTSCIQSSCERRNCSDLVKTVLCVRVDPKFCTKGCLCKDGFLKAKNGTCIPFNQCKEAQCEDNEIFDICPSTCPGEECGGNLNTTSCLPKLEPGNPSCQPRCRCCDGYLRNKKGKCIPRDECQYEKITTKW